MLRHLQGAPDAVLANVEAGTFQIPIPISQSAPHLRRIFRKYRDWEVDLADACLVHLAGELRTGEILTLDQDFEVYRWDASKRFRLLIPLR